MAKGSIVTIRENVISLLDKYPQTRNDDKDLIWTYWTEIDRIDPGNRFDFTYFATSPESIRRQRQLIQEDGMYLPSSEVVAKRRGRQEQMAKAVKLRRVI